MSLKTRVIWRCTSVATVVAAALLFVPAGTIRWWEGWVYLAIIAIPMFVFTAYYYHDPALVERRMRSQEKVPRQRIVMRLGSMVTPLVLVVPGLDHRFGWSTQVIGGCRFGSWSAQCLSL